MERPIVISRRAVYLEPVREPPPPHAPSERVALAALGAWQVRVFDPTGRHHAFFATRGFVHLQLWHEALGISVLTPSRLTAGRYEVVAVDGSRTRAADYAAARDAILRRHGVALPSERELVALSGWFLGSSARRGEPTLGGGA